MYEDLGNDRTYEDNKNIKNKNPNPKNKDKKIKIEILLCCKAGQLRISNKKYLILIFWMVNLSLITS
jgi:hypothetical protein